MAEIEFRFDNGKTVTANLSEETARNLREKLCKDDKQLIVDRFRALRTQDGDGLRLAIMNHVSDVWDGRWISPTNAKASYYFYLSEVREIIAGLSRMIDE